MATPQGHMEDQKDLRDEMLARIENINRITQGDMRGIYIHHERRHHMQQKERISKS